MKCTNANLNKAQSVKNDEYYTLLADIEREMRHYSNEFRDKVVYCNCDDARESNFFKYFSLNFERLGLKQLIATSYKEGSHGTLLVYNGDLNGNRLPDDDEIEVEELEGDGDFRSAECIEYLKQADIVVTNPPFSLFREYLGQLMEYDKKFLIIGNQSAITLKSVFPYLLHGRVWFGKTTLTGFNLPEGKSTKNMIHLCRWYTNIENNKWVDAKYLLSTTTTTNWSKYDNYDALNVDKIKNMPYDYDGVMGVPMTISDDVCSDGLAHFKDVDGNDVKYKIIGNFNNYSPAKVDNSIGQFCGSLVMIPGDKNRHYGPVVNGKAIFGRILIQKVK